MVKTHDGTRLAALMKRAGVSDAKLAAALGTSVQAVGKWKRQGVIARERIAGICRTLHCSSDELLGLQPITDEAAHAISEPETPSTAPLDRDRLADAIEAVTRMLPPNHHNQDPQGRAEVIVAAYEYLKKENSIASAERMVKGMLEFLSARGKAAEPSTGESNERGRETAR